MRRRSEVDDTGMRAVLTAWRSRRSRAGMRLRSLREAAGLTQLDLAARSGVTHEAISALECGRRSPRVATIERLAAALEMAPRDLVASPTDRQDLPR
jgi:transcriptional regulator with XRE-family HTH domain